MTGLSERRDAPARYMRPPRGREFADHPTAAESSIAAIFALATLLLRLVYIFRFRIDSDEPQHLHVVWGWGHGLLQYRDVFDNHAPLFHLLCAPFFAMADERADIVLRARLAMLPFYAVAVGCTYAIAAALFSRRVALWATTVSALFSGFFLTSLEFRADDLWTALWLLGFTLLVRAPAARGRSLAAGVLLGAALGASLKTVLLLASVALAMLAIPILVRTHASLPARRQPVAGHVLQFVAGLTVVPVSLIAYFAWRGALGAFYYGTVAHNVLPGLGLWTTTPLRILLVPVATPLLWITARRVARGAPTEPIGRRRVLVFLTAGFFLTLLLGVWPLVTREDFLPIDPLVVLLISGFLLSYRPAFVAGRRRLRHAVHFGLPIALTLVELVFLVYSVPPWQDDAQKHVHLIDAVLRLTAPTDYVMDTKGETIFRRRPFFYGLERVTRTRLERGLIVDDIAERLVATRTAVVVLDRSGFPPSGRAFMDEHYLSVGELRVLGQFLTPTAPLSASGSPTRDVPDGMRFDVAIPARYAIAAEDGRVDGLLDGSPYEGPRVLESGTHEFVAVRSSTPLVLIWAPALERGFSPFGLDGRH